MTHYIDFAEYYDLDHNITVDIPFYLHFAKTCPSPILELACGTGRILMPIAKAGFEIYGLDISANMLQVCRQAVDQHHLKNRVHLSQADMSSFDLSRKDFGLVFIALRSFMHLLTKADQLSCLGRVYDHLRPRGTIIMSAIAPDPERLAQEPSRKYVVGRAFDLKNGRHVIRKQRLVAHDKVNQVRQFEFKFEEYDQEGKLVRERLVPLYTRYIFRDQLQWLLEKVGFQLMNVYRDYNMNPYDGTGEMIVVACRCDD